MDIRVTAGKLDIGVSTIYRILKDDNQESWKGNSG